MKCPKCNSANTGYEWFDDGKGREGEVNICFKCRHVWDESGRDNCVVCGRDFFDGGHDDAICSQQCNKKWKVLGTIGRWMEAITEVGSIKFRAGNVLYVMGKSHSRLKEIDEDDLDRWFRDAGSEFIRGRVFTVRAMPQIDGITDYEITLTDAGFPPIKGLCVGDPGW